MAEENWGRWGADDERGALNLLDAAAVLDALTLPRKGLLVPLAQPLSRGTPLPPARGGFGHFMTRDGGDYAAGARRTGGFQFADDAVMMPLHMGTHIDALCHAWCDDRLYNGFPGTSVRSTGASRCGVEKIPPVAGRGILLDIVKVRGGALADGDAVSREDLAAALALAGAAIRPGDVMLVRTGWQERQDPGAGVDFDSEPGLDVAAAEWLAEAGAALVGADNFAIEQMPFPDGEVFPVHRRLIRDHGIPLLEGLVLAPLAELVSAPFLFVVAPLPIVGGTGSPVTPFAVL